jgi:hypothetical protein
MTSTRPRAIIVSEITQLLLLCEPLARAFRMDSAVSIAGTFAMSCIAGAVIMLATRKKNIWARDVLAGLAAISWLLATGLTVWQRELEIVEGVLTINLVAVAMLFTASAENWFCKDVTETVR